MEEVDIRESGFGHIFPSDSKVYVIMNGNEHSDDVLAVCKSLEKAKKEAIAFRDEDDCIYIVEANLL